MSETYSVKYDPKTRLFSVNDGDGVPRKELKGLLPTQQSLATACADIASQTHVVRSVNVRWVKGWWKVFIVRTDGTEWTI